MDIHPELDRLIVENLRDLDETSKRIEELGKLLLESISATFEGWIAKNSWDGGCDGKLPWTAPKEWDTDDQHIGFFYLDKGPDTGIGPHYSLSRYLGVANGQLCLWFSQEVTDAKRWKAVTAGSAEQLSGYGFSLSDHGNFYTPCSLSAKDMISAIEKDGDLKAVTMPIREALERAKNAAPSLGQILETARAR